MSFQAFPPALMILSPRLTKEGDPGSSVVGLDTTPLADGALTYCLENQLAYRLNKVSAAAPDGNLVLAPLNGPGRWLAAVAPAGESCVVQIGWDQPPVSGTVAANPGGGAPFPRDTIPNPLQVFFPSVKRGNQIEIFWSATLGNAVPNATNAEFSALPAVAFKATPTFPDDFFVVGNGQAGTRLGAPVGPLQSDVQYNSMTGSASFTVPAGTGDTVPLTVWLLYDSSLDLLYGGVNLGGFVPGAAVLLKATEYNAACATQPGPGALFPLGG